MSDDLEAAERELRYWRARTRIVEDRLGRFAAIACRGLVTPTIWTVSKGAEPQTVAPIQWTCQACRAKQDCGGACQNPACVLGEVARAFIAGAEQAEKEVGLG